MKKIVYVIALVFLAVNANAATSITTPSVSGHWTLAGSPYNVHNDITVNAGQSLTIDPGVQVVFWGSYRLLVYGSLNAAGTDGHTIDFTVSDTTGFSTDTVTAAGGWHGIQYQPYSGSVPDNSIFRYCNVSFVKSDSVDYYAVPDIFAFYARRTMDISSCTFSRSKGPKNVSNSTAFFETGVDDTINVMNCEFYSNSPFNTVARLDIATSTGFVNFIGNKLHDNISQNSIVSATGNALLFENCDLHQNSNAGNSGAQGSLTLEVNSAKVRNSKFYNNENPMDGAIFSFGGYVDIIGNLICNNWHTLGFCGLVDGGAGINLTNYSSAPTYYNIRENIIANNYSPFHGGGINIHNAAATITHNQIINNISNAGGGIYIYDTSDLIITNNIFYGNITIPDSTGISPAISGICTMSRPGFG